ncbi:drebrin-like protein isoform X1 [Acipenser ruthenus]|uniref:drebrin-like protein isoform X1 n=2 Tax=Acipenser ruthenus TaxID=7906 RepID=UPI002740AB75|nr:drebrin-like protein isoform X1 [Acipenser ruthenus]
MSVNLSKNGAALQAAYNEVVDGKSNTNWALFTYEGNSNDIRLAEKGDGGLEEMVEELSSGKVMYAFCRVQDPNSGLPKYVLINWTGEGVKDSRKGLCANHVTSMANFLKGAHVTINARSDDDVEPEAIMQKVAKASGANYSFHKESNRFRDAGPQGPVGSVYQKTNAVSEIKRTNKDTFWAQTERDEEKRRLEERSKDIEERERLEQERRAREQQEVLERERRDKERSSQIDQQKVQQQQQEAGSREQETQQREEYEREQQAARRPGLQRGASVEKANEAASLISQRSQNPRDMFKQKERAMASEPRDSPDSPQPGKLRSPFFSRQTSDSEPPLSPHRQASPLHATPASPVHAAVPSVMDQARSQYVEPEDPAQQDLKEKSIPIQREPSPSADLYEDVAGQEEPENLYEEPPQVEEASAVSEEPAALKGVCARALYDYQAADDTEVSFDPDDIITEIEMIDEGWWRGYAPDGRFGMFPANYVEILDA